MRFSAALKPFVAIAALFFFLAPFRAHGEERAAFEVEVSSPRRFAELLPFFQLDEIKQRVMEASGSDAFPGALRTVLEKDERNDVRQLLARLSSKGFDNLPAVDQAALIIAFLKWEYRTTKKANESHHSINKNAEKMMKLMPLKAPHPILSALTYSPDAGWFEMQVKGTVSPDRFEELLRGVAKLLLVPYEEIGAGKSVTKGIEGVHYNVSHDEADDTTELFRAYQVLVAMRNARESRIVTSKNMALKRDVNGRGHARVVVGREDLSHGELRVHWGEPRQEIDEWFSLARLPRTQAFLKIGAMLDDELDQFHRCCDKPGRLTEMFRPPKPAVASEAFSPTRDSFIVDAARLVTLARPESAHLKWLLTHQEFAAGFKRQVIAGEFSTPIDESAQWDNLFPDLARTEAGKALVLALPSEIQQVERCGRMLRNMATAIEQGTLFLKP